MTGKNIGHYRILRQIGKGGMGEVYLAEDTSLKREVAIKVLPEYLRNDPKRLARFRREAETAGKLKHPNIAPIFALEEAVPVDDGTGGDDVSVRARHASPQREHPDDLAPTLFIVMEYVEGQPLSSHIPSDGMDLDTFFATFIPLADALAHAHGHGRIHRDIKPGNIMIDTDGTPKILDFGLARIVGSNPMEAFFDESETPPEFDSETPTVTMKPGEPLPETPPPSITQGGAFMGTPAYMSPEQIETGQVDARTDLFSFGIVMYEALTGQRPFKGENIESIIGRILEAEPKPVTALKPITPHTLWWIIRLCLKKNREDRVQTAHELYTELTDLRKEVESGTVLVDASAIPKPEPVPLWRRPIPIVVMLVLTLAIGLAAAWLLKPAPLMPEPSLRKFDLTVDAVGNQAYDGPAISPDGTMIAYTQDGRLWIRDLDSVTPRELPDTEGGVRPFWSSNSDFVGYFTWDPQTLRKVAVTGGPSIPMCDFVGVFRGGAWRSDGTIVFGVASAASAREGVLYSVPSHGGERVVFAVADTSLDQRGLIYPTLLPDGSLLYAATVGEEDGALIVDTGRERREIVAIQGERVAFAVYSPTGHIVYQRGFPESKGIWAVPFDIGSLEVTDDSFPIDANGGYPTVSSDGTLVYRSAVMALWTIVPPGRLAWVDRQGRVEPVGKVWGRLDTPELSPNGRLVAFSAARQDNADVYVYDFERGTDTRLTYDKTNDINPVWSPDDRHVAFQSDAQYRGGGAADIHVRAVDGSGDAELLVGGSEPYWPSDWSPDGRHLIYFAWSDSIAYDIWYATLRDDGVLALDDTSQAFLRTPYSEWGGRLSPDGRYLAYGSNESGQSEVYVCPFPDGGSKWQVSSDRGSRPRWSPNGDELFYVQSATGTGQGSMMAVPVETTGGFRRGRVRRLFDAPEGVDLSGFDVSADGRRFMAVQRVGEAEQPQVTITVVENWAREFEGRE